MKRLIIAFILIAIVGGGTWWVLNTEPEVDPGAANQLKLATNAKELIPFAKVGDAGAQYRLGELYRNGTGIKKNLATAYYWYKKSAEQGLVSAQYSLGRAYELGEGVNQDFFAASKWYRLAASFGNHRDSQFSLGQMYFKGRGVEHDYGKAIKFYRLAARRGHPVAQYLLGAMYEEGWGVTKDYIAAYVWFKLASPKVEETTALSSRYNPILGLGRIKEKMNRYQIDEAEKRLKKIAKNP